MTYFKKDDIIQFALSEEKEAGSFEITPNITDELSDKAELIGKETLNASDFIRDSVLESVQAKIIILGIRKAS